MFGRRKKDEKFEAAWTPAEENWDENVAKRFNDAYDSGACPQCGKPTGPRNPMMGGQWTFRGKPAKLVPVEPQCMSCLRAAESGV